MGLKLQNVASRIVVLKFQEELAKRRQEVAARPTPAPVPTPRPMATPMPQENAITRGYYNAPPSGGGLLGAIGQGYSRLNRAATQGAANLTSLLGQKAEDFQNTVVIPNAYRAQLLSAGVLGTEGPPGTAGKSRLGAIREAIWPPSNAGSQGELAKIQQSWAQNPAGYRMGMETLFHPASYYAGPEALARLPEAIAFGPEFAGAYGLKTAAEAIPRMAELARPAVEAKVAELYPAVREAVVGGQRGSLGKLPEEVTGLTKAELAAPERDVMVATSASPFKFPDLNTLPEAEKVGWVMQELQRIGEGAEQTRLSQMGESVATFVNPEAAKGKTFLNTEVAQLRDNRIKGSFMAHHIEEYSRSNRKLFDIGPDNNVRTIPEELGLSRQYEDVMESPTLYREYLTPEQMTFAREQGAMFEELATWFENTTHEALGRTRGAEFYHPRIVTKIGDVKVTTPSDMLRRRIYPTMAEGKATAHEYAPDSAAVVGDAVRTMYNRGADAVFGREYASTIGKRPIDMIAPELLENATVRIEAEKATKALVAAKMKADYAAQQEIVVELQKDLARATKGRSADLKANRLVRQQTERELATAQRRLGLLRATQTGQREAGAATLTRRAAGQPDMAAINRRLTAADQDIAQLEGEIQYRRGRASVPSPNPKDAKRLTFLRQWKQDMQANLREWRTAGDATTKQIKAQFIQGDMAKWDANLSNLVAERDTLLAQVKSAAKVDIEGQAAVKQSIRSDLALERSRLRMMPKFSNAALLRNPDMLAARAASRRAIRMAQVAKGRVEGGRGLVKVTGRAGGGRFFPEDIARTIVERSGVRESPSGLRTAADYVFMPLRGAKTAFDLGVALIHGWNPLMVHPIKWGSAFRTAMDQIARNTAGKRAAWEKTNAGVIYELADNLFKVRGLRQEVGVQLPRVIEQLFSHPLNVGAVEIWKGAKNIYQITATPEDAAKMKQLADVLLKEMGTVRHGGGINEERALFAARFLRSLIGVAGDATKGGIRGTEARKIFRNMFTLAGAGTIVISELQGQDWTLDLRDVRAFTVRIGNQRVSLLGPWAPLFRAIAHVVTGDPAYLITRTLRSKLAPGLSNFVDFVSGEDFLGHEVNITKPETLVPYLASQAVPLAQGQAYESTQGIDWRSPKEVLLAAAMAGLNILGGRVNPVMDYEKRNDVARQMFKGRTWDKLSEDEQDQLNVAHPEFVEAQTRETERRYSALDQLLVVQKEMGDAKIDYKAGMEQVPLQPDGPSQVAMYRSTQENYIAGINRIRRSNSEVFAEWEKQQPKTARQAVYKGYTDIFGQFSDPATGLLLDDKKDMMFQAIDTYMAGLTDAQVSDLNADIGAGDSDWLKQYHADSKTFKPYWDVDPQVWQEFAKETGFPTYNDYYDSIMAEAVKSGMTREMVIASNVLDNDPIVKMFTSVRADEHNAMLAQNPEMAQIGLHYGWISSIRQDTLPIVAGALMGGAGTPAPVGAGSTGQPFNWGR